METEARTMSLIRRIVDITAVSVPALVGLCGLAAALVVSLGMASWPPRVPLQPSERVCHETDPALVARIEAHLRVPGVTLRGARTVRSALHPDLSLVGADLQGAGYEGDRDIGVWLVKQQSISVVYPYNDLASRASRLGAAYESYDRSEDGAKRNLGTVETCVHEALPGVCLRLGTWRLGC